MIQNNQFYVKFLCVVQTQLFITTDIYIIPIPYFRGTHVVVLQGIVDPLLYIVIVIRVRTMLKVCGILF